ncbi:MAG: hypothetical protein RMN52_06775 [Anaerolineae bacterium]|nr:hypothetical protein [Candidatus Roseilinea sp.]MDW8449690.1 hypothetical protein [Anaerolineae bacterium]
MSRCYLRAYVLTARVWRYVAVMHSRIERELRHDLTTQERWRLLILKVFN